MDTFTVNCAPTKTFFVEMLTRDIGLNDSILDLLDNCLDGVVRSCQHKGDADKPYIGYHASIEIDSSSFVIKDNCGGIPRDIAIDYAFRMGRANQSVEKLNTVGIYGIGMKRAIFKIGRCASVHTRNNGESYTVRIPTEWSNSPDDWSFPLENNPEDNTLLEDGTIVSIDHLNDAIAELWETKDKVESFVKSLSQAIQESYSLIIQKGFAIIINGKEIPANPITLLMDESNGEVSIKPYIYTSRIDDVSIKIAIGFYSSPPSDEDIDDMNEIKRSTPDAGISIACNDRIVLYNDKSYLTGWGTNGIPKYHTQFIAIRGIVLFESSNPKLLPMTTTKRGVDFSSQIYCYIKEKICEGLRLFTNYTNKWKGQNQQERVYSRRAESISYEDVFSAVTEQRITMQQKKNERVYRPTLPAPSRDKNYRIIRFSKDAEEINELRTFFFGEPDERIKASTIGERCFEEMLTTARKK